MSVLVRLSVTLIYTTFFFLISNIYKIHKQFALCVKNVLATEGGGTLLLLL